MLFFVLFSGNTNRDDDSEETRAVMCLFVFMYYVSLFIKI